MDIFACSMAKKGIAIMEKNSVDNPFSIMIIVATTFLFTWVSKLVESISKTILLVLLMSFPFSNML